MKSCCSASYSHPLTRWLLGDLFHPGGLALTMRLARIANIGPHSLVLDVGSGLGTSSMHLAATTGCRAVGVTLELEGAHAGVDVARQKGVEHRVKFLEGDIRYVDLPQDEFDVALMECVLSIIPNKQPVLKRVHDVLKPDGRLAFSDVTLKGQLPDDLRSMVASIACLGDALSLDGYIDLMKSAGYAIEYVEDLRPVAIGLMRDVKLKLMMAELAMRLGNMPINPGLLSAAKKYVERASAYVSDGRLSYAMVVARE